MKRNLWKSAMRMLVCAIAPLLLGACAAGHGPAPRLPTSVVLVHGAWADGSTWSRVIPLLQQRGLTVVAVQLQRASLEQDAQIVRRAIAMQSGQVVLAGHSYGGAVITEAGSVEQVAALVYVAAFAPGDGESIADITSTYPPGAWQSGLVADSAGYLWLNLETYVSLFAADFSRAEAAVYQATQGPVFQHILQDKVSNAAWKTKPAFWALSGNDQIIPTALQRQEASRIHARVTLIPGASHISLLSRPNEVAAVILEAVASVNGR